MRKRKDMILDVGCGNNPKGDVNVDLYPQPTMHRGKESSSYTRAIDLRTTENFIKADIHHLPFENETFSKILCHNVLEHEGVYFTKAIHELFRVSKDELEIVVPHRYCSESVFGSKRCKFHNKVFNVRVLGEWLSNQSFPEWKINVMYRMLPHTLLPILRIPHTIMLIISKKKRGII